MLKYTGNFCKLYNYVFIFKKKRYIVERDLNQHNGCKADSQALEALLYLYLSNAYN